MNDGPSAKAREARRFLHILRASVELETQIFSPFGIGYKKITFPKRQILRFGVDTETPKRYNLICSGINGIQRETETFEASSLRVFPGFLSLLKNAYAASCSGGRDNQRRRD